MKTPILGIVIPTKNESDNIENLLDSLLPQVPYNATVIISDNSNDDTVDKINSYEDDRIKIIKGGNPAKSRNKGAKHLNSEYILFLDADMVLPKNLIRKSIKALRDKNPDLLTCKVRTKKKMKVNLFYRLNNLLVKLSKWDKPFAISSYFLIKRETFQDLGGFDETLSNCEDYWLSKKIDRKKFRVLNSKIYTGSGKFEGVGIVKIMKHILKSIKNRKNYVNKM